MSEQNLHTSLIPEQGLDLLPEFAMESKVATDFIRAIAHIVGQSISGSVMLRCTSGGDLRVAVVGVGYEVYETETGIAADAYNAGDTFTYVTAINVIDVLVETFGAVISFRNSVGVWGDDKSLPVGFYSFDFVHYGVRIRNRVVGSNAVYEFTVYS